MTTDQSDSDKLWLVVISNTGSPQCISCDDVPALQEAFQQDILKADEVTYAFAFKGERIKLSSPQPVASIKIGDKMVTVGKETFNFDESGKFNPIIRDR
jgi:hypothetical protein